MPICIQGQCEKCGRSRILRPTGELFCCAECHGERPDAFEMDDEYQRDVADHGIDGWGA